MRPFDHTGLRNPRLLWRPHEPAESGEKPTAAVTKAGMPRQTAMPGVGPLCSGSSDNRRPHRMRRFRRFRGSQTPAKPLTLHPPVFDGYHQSGQEQMPEPRTEPYRSGEHRYREISRLLRHPATTGRADVPPHPTYAADHAGRTEATESLRPQPTSVLLTSTMPFDSTVSAGRTMPMQPQPTTALPTDDADMPGATAVIEPSSSADTGGNPGDG